MDFDMRDGTLAVLLDVSAARKVTDDKLAEYGPVMARSSKDLKDGLQPDLKPTATESILALMMDPSWANTLFAATVNTMCADEDKLRDFLVQVASVAVHWIETLDERNKGE